MEWVIPLDVSSFPFLNLIMKLNIFIQFQAATRENPILPTHQQREEWNLIVQQDHADPLRKSSSNKIRLVTVFICIDAPLPIVAYQHIQIMKKYANWKAMLISWINLYLRIIESMWKRVVKELPNHPRPRMREVCRAASPPSTLPKASSLDYMLWYSQIYSVHDKMLT